MPTALLDDSTVRISVTRVVVTNTMDLILMVQDTGQRALDAFVEEQRRDGPLALSHSASDVEARMDALRHMLAAHLQMRMSCLQLGFNLPHGQSGVRLRIGAVRLPEGILLKVMLKFSDFEHEELMVPTAAILPATFADT